MHHAILTSRLSLRRAYNAAVVVITYVPPELYGIYVLYTGCYMYDEADARNSTGCNFAASRCIGGYGEPNLGKRYHFCT